MNGINNNSIFPDSEIINMIVHLSSIEEDSSKVIEKMKTIYTKIDNINSRDINEIKHSDKEGLKNIIKIFITQEYLLTGMLIFKDIEDKLIRNSKIVNYIISSMKNDDNLRYIERPFIVNEIEKN